MPIVRVGRGLADRRWQVLLRRVRSQGVGHVGNDFSQDEDTADRLVRDGLVPDQPEERCSALGLQRILGLGSYRTAWMMLHKLRTAMVRPDRDLLTGDVEVDETYLGGVDIGRRGGRQRDSIKEIVVIGVEMHSPKGFGRVRLRRVEDLSAASLVGFITDVVEPGSVIITDGWNSYLPLPRHGYTHKRTSIRAGDDPAHVVQPGVHRVASLLKRWLMGTHQGAIRPEHLDAYLEEFTFRFNRRSSRRRGLLFYRLLEQAVVTDPAPYKDLVGGGIITGILTESGELY